MIDRGTAGWLTDDRLLSELTWRLSTLRSQLVAASQPQHWSGMAQRACSRAITEVVMSLDRAGLELDEAARLRQREIASETVRVG